MHDELDSCIRKTKVMETKSKKLPVYIAKSFLEVELESNIPFFLFDLRI